MHCLPNHVAVPTALKCFAVLVKNNIIHTMRNTSSIAASACSDVSKVTNPWLKDVRSDVSLIDLSTTSFTITITKIIITMRLPSYIYTATYVIKFQLVFILIELTTQTKFNFYR